MYVHKIVVGLACIFFAYSPFCAAVSLYDAVKKGNALFKQEKYEEALNTYIDAQVEHPEEALLKYNIASSYYKMKNYEEALKGYQEVAASARDKTLEEKAWYNAGNALYRLGRLEEALAYYTKALELDPQDKDAQHNLEFVREEIKRRINEAKKTEKKQEEQQQQKQNDKTCPAQQQPDRAVDNQTQHRSSSSDNRTGEDETQKGTTAPEQGTAMGENRNEKETGGSDTAQSGAAFQDRQLSPEEAEQLLSTVQENRDNLKESKQPAIGRAHPHPAQDW